MAEVDQDEDGLDVRRVTAILEAVTAGNAGTLAGLLGQLHAADVADLLEQISAQDRRALLALGAAEIDGEVLSELDESIREEVIAALPREAVAQAMRGLESDDVVDILEDLDQPQQSMILGVLDAVDRAAVEQALTYPEDSAGRLMQREVVVAPEHWTVGETTDHLRGADWLPDQFYHVVLVDPRMRPTGYATLGRILSSGREVRLRDIVEDSFRTIEAVMPDEDVAYLFNQYHLISCPVVAQGGRLVGVITIDDAMAVLEEEAEEDMLRLAGVGDGARLSDTWFQTAKQRFPWLFVNLMTAFLASSVVGLFEGTILKIVALAVLMPIVASQGGNAGTQGLTVAVRALATKDLTSSNVRRVIWREIAQGVANGVMFAVITGVLTYVWFGQPLLGVVIGAAMIINLFAAALAGLLIPLGLEKLGFDPALSSGAFVTTVTDVVGFFAFLWLAGLVLL